MNAVTELVQGMEAPPLRVHRTLHFFRHHSLWHVVSRNTPATSCRDAAARRQRLGTQGIPLHDELKSMMMAAYFPGGERRYVLLHCRANTRFDLETAARLLKVERPLARLASEELEHKFENYYGTVNPFSEAESFIQVFDDDLLNQYTAPHTLMTNAGDLTWAVEFEAAPVIEALHQVSPQVMVGRIATSSNRSYHLPTFGIITGNGPESGMALWRHLNAIVYQQLTMQGRLYGDISYPRVIIHSLPEMGFSMELREREEQVWKVLQEAVQQLIDAKVDYIAIACNTTQFFAERIRALCKPAGVEFVSMAEVVLDYIRRNGLDDITLIGIPVVAELGDYSAYRPLRDLQVQPVAEITKPHLQELGYMVKRLDHTSQDSKALNKLTHILKSGVNTSKVLILDFGQNIMSLNYTAICMLYIQLKSYQ